MAGAILGTFALAGCGPTTTTSATATSHSNSKGPYTIGLDVFFEGNSWQAENVSLFEKECKAYGPKIIKKYIVANANSSTSQQIAQIQDMIDEHVSAILLDANSATGLNAVLAKAQQAGIPVINYDTIVTGDVTSKINTNQSRWGTITAQWLIKKLHGHGNIIVLNGLAGNPTNNLRYEGAQKLFSETPGIHVLATAYDDWSEAPAEASVSNMLAAYPKINGVWSQGGAMTAGAVLDFVKAGRPLVPMTGEAYNGLLKLWTQDQSKGFDSIAPGQPNYLVTLSLHAALRYLEGYKVPKVVNVPLPVITSKTVSKYVEPSKPSNFWVLDHISKANIQKLLGPKVRR